MPAAAGFARTPSAAARPRSPRTAPPLGAVLVGGSSRRMGADKALIDWHGVPLAKHVAERLREACGRVVLVGGAGRGYEGLGLPWRPDPPNLAGAGPLAGLLAALELAPAVLLTGCDLPYLDPQVIRGLLAAARHAPVAVPLVDGRLEPLLGVYRREAAPVIKASLAAGSGKMADVLRCRGARLVPGEVLGTPDRLRLAFRNLNYPADLPFRAGARKASSS